MTSGDIIATNINAVDICSNKLTIDDIFAANIDTTDISASDIIVTNITAPNVFNTNIFTANISAIDMFTTNITVLNDIIGNKLQVSDISATNISAIDMFTDTITSENISINDTITCSKSQCNTNIINHSPKKSNILNNVTMYCSDNTSDLTINNGTNNIYFNNNGNGWSTSSDIRLKENIVKIPDTLTKIEQIHGYYYNYIGTESTHIGIMAQEVKPIFPEAVSTVKDHLVVNYSELIPVLINSINELNKKVTSLEAQVYALHNAN